MTAAARVHLHIGGSDVLNINYNVARKCFYSLVWPRESSTHRHTRARLLINDNSNIILLLCNNLFEEYPVILVFDTAQTTFYENLLIHVNT